MADRVKLTKAQEMGIRALVRERDRLAQEHRDMLDAISEHIRLYARELGLPPGEYDVRANGAELELVSHVVEETT